MPGIHDSEIMKYLPDWISAIGTVFAFMVAAFTFLKDYNQRKISQARRVYSKLCDMHQYDAGEEFCFTTGGSGIAGGRYHLKRKDETENLVFQADANIEELVVQVANGSSEPIGPVKVRLFNYSDKELIGGAAGTLEWVEPNTVDKYTLLHDYPPGRGTVTPVYCEILFRDSAGHWWKRRNSDPVESIPNDPENNERLTSEERSWARSLPMGDGIHPMDPKVSLKTRIQRHVRKTRGKSPIP